MTRHVFPDNTVLINFTYLNRHDLIVWFTRGNPLWTVSVSQECFSSSRVGGLEAMTNWFDVFGEPLAPSESEREAALKIADSMRKPGENAPRKHMGEAETLAITTERRLAGIFLTDDRDAMKKATSMNVPVFDTVHILAFAEVAGKITHDEARNYLADLLNRGRAFGTRARFYDELVAELRMRRANS